MIERKIITCAPNIPDRAALHAALDKVLDSGQLTNRGYMVKELEERVAEMVGVRHCIATSSATMGLWALIKALDPSAVFMPSFTFPATRNAVQDTCPVGYIDIDPLTHLMNTEDMPGMIRGTRWSHLAIGVHTWGNLLTAGVTEQIAAKYEIDLIFDAAHAFGASYNGRMAGTFGRASVFSLHATKVVNGFEGGLVTTNDPDLCDTVRALINNGYGAADFVPYSLNAKMSEIHAAAALVGIDHLEYIIWSNERNYYLYKERLGSLILDHHEGSNYHYIVAVFENLSQRLRVQEALQKINVYAINRFNPPVHKLYGNYTDLPHTDDIAPRVLLLPNGIDLIPSEIVEICDVILREVEDGNTNRD